MTGKQVKDTLYIMGVKLGKLAEDMGMTQQNFSAALIERLRGEQWLISVRDRYRNPHNYVKHIDAGLKRIIASEPYNRLTTYWARHTWATLAYNELGASIDLISAALGHQYGSRVTAVYINPDLKRVDELNRQLLDLIFCDFAL